MLNNKKDIHIEIKQLEETIRVLQSENEYLASRSEDSLFIGLISEEIARTDDVDRLLKKVLERISILKDVQFCAYCTLKDQTASILNAYLSFTESSRVINKKIQLESGIHKKLSSGACLLRGNENIETDAFEEIQPELFSPCIFLIIPFKNSFTGEGIYFFADSDPDENLASLEVPLNRIVELVNARIENLYLMNELKILNASLDRQVEERTKNLILANEKLHNEITERKKLEEQLVQAQKMEALGTLAGGIAHDFNNILMGVNGYTSMMLNDLHENHPYFEKLKKIENQVQSASELTKRLLGLARGGKYEVKPVDLNELIIEASEIFGRLKKEITISRFLKEGVISVEADRGQIEQVFMNIFVNAWQAMPQGGVLTIETDIVSSEEKFIQLHGIKPGFFVKSTFADTGIGMDEQTRLKVFEPFFTTKEKGVGTGLGLASAYGIIRNHGGFIEVESKKGEGTTFSIYLPVSEKIPLNEKKTAGLLLEGTGTILLVDDQNLITDVGAEMLEMLGYSVIIASSGLEAIEKYSAARDEIKIVILDMIMPGLGGGETFDKLRNINPEVKVILSSGYSIDGQASGILDRGCNGFIQKPFSLQELSIKLHKILDQ